MAAPASITTMAAAPNTAPIGCRRTVCPKAARFITAATGVRRTIPDAAYQHLGDVSGEQFLERLCTHLWGQRAGGAVSKWADKGARTAPPRMRRLREKRIAGVVGAQPAVVIAFDEMWTYRQARRQGNR